MNKVKLKKKVSPLRFIKNTPVLPVVSQRDVKELLKLFEEQNLKNTFFVEDEDMDKKLDKN